MCGNCGENVYQCHKCRAINYDEKDPFLCNTCGYCKYAKFDYTIVGRACCAVDSIENDEDKKKAITNINVLLEKADLQHKQLHSMRTNLDDLLTKLQQPTSLDLSRNDDPATGGAALGGVAVVGATVNVNRTIQQLAQKYCVDCKTSYDELSKIIQKILACRKELSTFEQHQNAISVSRSTSQTPMTPVDTFSDLHIAISENIVDKTPQKTREKMLYCYGCTSATVEHCITLLRAMASINVFKSSLSDKELLNELFTFNLRRGSLQSREDVKQLLCLMSRDQCDTTKHIMQSIMESIQSVLSSNVPNNELESTIRHEMSLLGSMLHVKDTLWEDRIRYVVMLLGLSHNGPNFNQVHRSVETSCLRLLEQFCKDSDQNKVRMVEQIPGWIVTADLAGFLARKPSASFNSWTKSCLFKIKKEALKNDAMTKNEDKKSVRSLYLSEKFFQKWIIKTKSEKTRLRQISLSNKEPIRRSIFDATSAVLRKSQCDLLESLCNNQSRKKLMVDLCTTLLDDVAASGEAAAEFLALYRKLIGDDSTKFYVAIKGGLFKIADLIKQEISELTRLGDMNYSSDFTQGFTMKSLTDILAMFLELEPIKRHFKNRLVGSILDSYLSLRRLCVQQTKMVDDTQQKLLEILEQLTSGNESETKEFMMVCVDTINRFPPNDLISPVFIFERLCSIIYPETNEAIEFHMSLEKDPQQEDFLQGRMLGNPYSSNQSGLAPLMRNVKDKICQDCELIALLEDDTGMELLVNNKIISLDLPVQDVYKKIWLPNHNKGEVMRVVYRMRGLLGDATEDMVNTLDSGKDADIDCEEVYKMANVMNQCPGLKVMLYRLSLIKNLVVGRPLMLVLLKLFSYCVKVKSNREALIQPHMNTINIMLAALNLALLAEQQTSTSNMTQTLSEQILQIMELVLLEASSQPPHIYKSFSKQCGGGDKDQLVILLGRIKSPYVRNNQPVLQALMRLVPHLAFGEDDKMVALVEHFLPYLNFNNMEEELSEDEQVHLDCFCTIVSGIEMNANGTRLKDLIVDRQIVRSILLFILNNSQKPVTGHILLDESYKNLISKPSLPYALRILTGLCQGHDPIKLLISNEIVLILHHMEQIHSNEGIGSLAENLLEALRQNPEVAKKIEEVRLQTKKKKVPTATLR